MSSKNSSFVRGTVLRWMPTYWQAMVERNEGHNNLKTTLGYVHTADKRLHEAVDKLSAIVTIL